MDYARENLASAEILMEKELFNPCLQNIQQAIEKALKAVLVYKDLSVKKTHSIQELIGLLEKENIRLDISEEKIEFIDSIYLPSKYPLGSVLPNFEPAREECSQGLAIAMEIHDKVKSILA